MDGRYRPRTTTSRPPAVRPPIERDGNLVRLRFDLRPASDRTSTTAWYHAAAIREDADREPR